MHIIIIIMLGVLSGRIDYTRVYCRAQISSQANPLRIRGQYPESGYG